MNKEEMKELKRRIKEQEKYVTQLANDAFKVEGKDIIIHKSKREEYNRELKKLEELWDEEEKEKSHLEMQIGHRYATYVIVDDGMHPKINGKATYYRIPIQKAYEYEPKIIDGQFVVEVTPNPEYKGDITKITRGFTTEIASTEE